MRLSWFPITDLLRLVVMFTTKFIKEIGTACLQSSQIFFRFNLLDFTPPKRIVQHNLNRNYKCVDYLLFFLYLLIQYISIELSSWLNKKAIH